MTSEDEHQLPHHSVAKVAQSLLQYPGLQEGHVPRKGRPQSDRWATVNGIGGLHEHSAIISR